MPTKDKTKRTQPEFISPYNWLLAPGDHVQADHYTSPTIIRSWSEVIPFGLPPENKQEAYGQWIAQLLQNQLGAEDLVSMYRSPKEPDQTEWPFTLRSDVISALDKYFAKHMKASHSK